MRNVDRESSGNLPILYALLYIKLRRKYGNEIKYRDFVKFMSNMRISKQHCFELCKDLMRYKLIMKISRTNVILSDVRGAKMFKTTIYLKKRGLI